MSIASLDSLTQEKSWRYWLLISVVAAAVLALALYGPIPQDPAYHVFADQRPLLGIPNFWNVISNLPLLIVGLVGLRSARNAYIVLFAGVILTAFGSTWYHLNPNNNPLTWDRLPMTVAIMALLSIVISEHIDRELGRLFLPVLILLGVSSVLVWDVSERIGHGDLRPYALVQFLPLVLIAMILPLFPRRGSNAPYIWATIAAYGVSKIFEVYDAWFFDTLRIVSGHTAKHLIAATAVCALVMAATRRSAPST